MQTFCVHCGFEPNQYFPAQNCDCGESSRTPMPVPEERLDNILDSLTRVSGEFRRFRHYDAPASWENDSVSCGDFEHTRKQDVCLTDYFEPNYMSGSDYSGGSVEVSNHKAFMEEFAELPGVHRYYGGYGTYGVIVRLDCITPRMLEVLQGLDNYPVIDENLMSEVEREAEDEAWENWAASDFRRALEKELRDDSAPFGDADIQGPHPQYCRCEDCIGDWLYDVDSDALRVVLERAADKANVYWENETGNSAYIDVERVAKHVTFPALMEEIEAHIKREETNA